MIRVLEQARCDPSVIILEFESSVELAIVAVFSKHDNIQYCFYHLTQSIWGNIQSLGLTTLYEMTMIFVYFVVRLTVVKSVKVSIVEQISARIDRTGPP